MKRIQQVTRALLALSVFAILIVMAGYGLHRATYHPSLYTPPPGSRDHASVRMVREATDLEGLRKVCEFWAETDDSYSAMENMQRQRFEYAMTALGVGLSIFAGVFTIGLGYIYRELRRLEQLASNAL
jgi:ABC-type uncharacterized transport system permease subunit